MKIKVTHKGNNLVVGIMVKRQPYNILAVYMHETTVLLSFCR